MTPRMKGSQELPAEGWYGQEGWPEDIRSPQTNGQPEEVPRQQYMQPEEAPRTPERCKQEFPNKGPTSPKSQENMSMEQMIAVSMANKTTEEKPARSTVETVKGTTVLPKLTPPSQEPDPGVRCGVWLVKVSIFVADLSDTGTKWWRDVSDVAKVTYDRYLEATPMERLIIKVENVEDDDKYSRVKARVTTMLLDAMLDPKDSYYSACFAPISDSLQGHGCL
jgi:hypothetical protein